MTDINERRKEMMRSKHTSMERKLGIDGALDKLKQVENMWQQCNVGLASREGAGSPKGSIGPIKFDLAAPYQRRQTFGSVGPSKDPRSPARGMDTLETSSPIKNLYSPGTDEKGLGSPIALDLASYVARYDNTGMAG